MNANETVSHSSDKILSAWECECGAVLNKGELESHKCDRPIIPPSIVIPDFVCYICHGEGCSRCPVIETINGARMKRYDCDENYRRVFPSKDERNSK